MSHQGVHANFEPIEESLNGEVTHTLKRKSRHITLTNDSGSDTLKYKFNASEAYGTLKPTESVDMDVWVRTVFLQTTTSVDYRLWVYG